MPLNKQEDCCTFLEGKTVEKGLQRLTRDDLPVLAAILGMHSAITNNRSLLLPYIQGNVFGISGVREERVDEEGAGGDTHINPSCFLFTLWTSPIIRHCL